MNLPNYITLVRIFLVPIFFSLLAYYNAAAPELRWWALFIFTISMFTDALDGILARRLRQQTRLGTFLDPLADKLLLLSGFLGIAFSNAFPIKPPEWIVIMIVFRDLFLVGGLAIFFMLTSELPIAPNLIGKVTTFLQMMTIVSVLIQWKFSYWVWLPTAACTAVSALSYLLRAIRFLNSTARNGT